MWLNYGDWNWIRTRQTLDPDLLAEILEALNPETQTAIEMLVAKNGRIPWAEFIRRFGDIREMGPGKRDREKPHLNPASTAEILFYRALLARAFFNTTNGAQEFAPMICLNLLTTESTENMEKERRKSPRTQCSYHSQKRA